MTAPEGTWVALECSKKRASFAISRNGEEHRFCLAQDQTQTAHMVPVLKEKLEAIDIDSSEVSDLALHVGPGSATGLRMAVALAQGWSLVHPDVCVHAVTLEACCQVALKEWEGKGDLSQAVLLSDAFGGEVFLQKLELVGIDWKLVGDMKRHPREVINSLEGPLYILEDLGSWKEKIEWGKDLLRYDDSFPTAHQVLGAAKSGEYVREIERVDVRYLKPSSAELLWEKRHSEKG